MDIFVLFVNISWEPQVNILTQACVFSHSWPLYITLLFQNTWNILKYWCIVINVLHRYYTSLYTKKKWMNPFFQIFNRRKFWINLYYCWEMTFYFKLFYNFSLFRDWVKVAQLCLTLCDPMDYTVHGILQARKLEWVAILSSRAPSQPREPRSPALQANSLPAELSSKIQRLNIIYIFHPKNLFFFHKKL